MGLELLIGGLLDDAVPRCGTGISWTMMSEPAQFFDGPIDKLLWKCRIGHAIHPPKSAIPQPCFALPRAGPGSRSFSMTDAPAAAKLLRDGAPDTAARAGDESGLRCK